MSRRSNREFEEECFRQFSSHYPVPPGTVVHQDKPDVIIDGPRKIGIEIARLYLGNGKDPHSEQVQRRRRDIVVREAQAQYLRSGNENVAITVSFDPNYPIDDTTVVAGHLAGLVASNRPKGYGPVTKILLSWIPEVRSLYLRKDPDHSWLIFQHHTVPVLSVPRVVKTVGEKNRLLAGYEHCDEYWLLLIVDLMDAAQDQDISWPAGAPSLQTNFQRVIVYKPGFRDCTEVPVS
jgi:hypothetical protein